MSKQINQYVHTYEIVPCYIKSDNLFLNSF